MRWSSARSATVNGFVHPQLADRDVVLVLAQERRALARNFA
jgi:hypothetical protein